jgi:hypothetical protein
MYELQEVKETKLWKRVSKKMSEKKYIILKQILGMVLGQQPTDQCTVSCRTGVPAHYRPEGSSQSCGSLQTNRITLTGDRKQLQGMGERLRFKFFLACEEQSR